MAQKSWAQWYALFGVVAGVSGLAITVVMAAIDSAGRTFPSYWIGVPLLLGSLAVLSIPFVAGGWLITQYLRSRRKGS